MPPKDIIVEEIKAWLFEAGRDFFAAKWDWPCPLDLSNKIGYNLQQAVERTEKCFLMWNNVDYPKIHDLQALGNLCSKIDPTLSESLNPATILTDFAGKGKYTQLGGGLTQDEIRILFKTAETAIKEILKRFPVNIAAIYYNYLAEGEKYLK
jgi:hypothetical protein